LTGASGESARSAVARPESRRSERGSGPIPVDQPLCLISQVQRSGGTLLLRLLDGHPQCHVVPFQLRGIDAAAKRAATKPERVWSSLHDPKLVERVRGGYRQRKGKVLRDEQAFSFSQPPDLQRAIYESCAALLPERSVRGLVDCYLTSYFNAWLDYGNLDPGPKRWVVAFEPGIAQSLGRRDAIRTLYPDGKVISIVRDPWSWYASARRWEPRWTDREEAIGHWRRISHGTLKWRSAARAHVRVLTFDALLSRTEETMRQVADWLEIGFTPGLLQPTFNGQPIGANSSFADVAGGVSTKPLERARDELAPDDVSYIEERAGEIYAKLANRAKKDWPELS
jgi:hypothetical protein